MILYLDASALVKRYVPESGSDIVRSAMEEADIWFMCRVGFVETMRAVGLVAGNRAAAKLQREWPTFGVIEVDQELAQHAAALATTTGLRSLDSLHLASALLLGSEALTLATWDRRLHAAAIGHGLEVLPQLLA